MKKVWFITGASRGLGVAIARAALDAGDDVVATGRDSAAVEKAIGSSERLLAVTLDVTKRGAPEEAVKAAFARFGRIDVVVNNAGYALYGAMEEYTDEELRRQIETNVFGTIGVTRAVLPTLRAQRSGRIFNLSSVAGFVGHAGASAYDASKFAIEGLSESLFHEVAPLGIKVTIIEPGLFRTEFLTSGSSVFTGKTIADYDATSGATRQWMRETNGTQANDPKKLARAIVTLANIAEPPLRFTAGADAVRWFEAMLASKRAELERWRELSESLAFEQ